MIELVELVELVELGASSALRACDGGHCREQQ
jgi:hypothetical protein